MSPYTPIRKTTRLTDMPSSPADGDLLRWDGDLQAWVPIEIGESGKVLTVGEDGPGWDDPPPGEPGPAGPAGNDGADGKDGVDGATGPAGPNLISLDTTTVLTGLIGGDGDNVIVVDPATFAAASHTHSLAQVTDAGDAAALDVGAAAGTVCAGDDSRLSDAREPTAHTHAQSDVTDLIGDLAGKAASVHTHELADITDAGDAAGLDVGSEAGTVCAGDDARLSDARTPTPHAASHAHDGSDPVTVAQSQVSGLGDSLSGKADAVHTHAILDVTGLADALGDKLEAVDWGDIGGTLSDQEDLQSALNAKADSDSLADVATSGAAADVSYNSETSELAAPDVQAAIDEVVGVIGGIVSAASPLTLEAASPGDTPFTLKGAAGQTAPLQRLVDSDGNVVAALLHDGTLVGDGVLSIRASDTGNAASVTVKGAGGTETSSSSRRVILHGQVGIGQSISADQDFVLGPGYQCSLYSRGPSPGVMYHAQRGSSGAISVAAIGVRASRNEGDPVDALIYGAYWGTDDPPSLQYNYIGKAHNDTELRIYPDYVHVDGYLSTNGGVRIAGVPVIGSNRVLHSRPYTVATVPSAATEGAGAQVYVSNGRAGQPVLAVSDGTDWLRTDTYDPISAT